MTPWRRSGGYTDPVEVNGMTLTAAARSRVGGFGNSR